MRLFLILGVPVDPELVEEACIVAVSKCQQRPGASGAKSSAGPTGLGSVEVLNLLPMERYGSFPGTLHLGTFMKNIHQSTDIDLVDQAATMKSLASP